MLTREPGDLPWGDLCDLGRGVPEQESPSRLWVRLGLAQPAARRILLAPFLPGALPPFFEEPSLDQLANPFADDCRHHRT